MKKRSFAVPAILVLLLLSACTRSRQPRSVHVIKKRLTQFTHVADTLSATQIERDVAGRITRIETSEEINLFHYTGDSILLSEFSKSAGREVYLFSGLLNSAGAIVTGMSVSNYGFTQADTNMHQFSYDEAGHLVKELRIDGKNSTFAVQYEYRNHDAVKITTYHNQVLTNTKQLEYYAQLDNHTGLEDYKFRRNCNGLAGTMSAHLVKRITSVTGIGHLNYDFTYEYETDAEGLPVKAISKSGKKVNAVTTFLYAAK